MQTKSRFTLFAAGVVAALAFGGPALVEASDQVRRPAARDTWNGIHADRGELRAAHTELNRDRVDLNQLHRQGASRADITHKQHEINDDHRQIAKERSEIRGGYNQLRRDRDRFSHGWGHDGRFDNHNGWNRNDNHRWGWDRRGRFASDDHWRRDYRRD